MTSELKLNKEEPLQCKAERLYSKCDLEDRKWKLKTYKSCFIGSEIIAVIIKLKFASNTDEAIEFGNKLLNSNLICHVENDHIFKNENLFYKFTDKFHREKKRNTQHLTPLKFTNHWNSFGSLSKSEFSFLSDRSSFAASLNTLSDTNRWIVESPNNDKEKEQKINYSDKNIEFSAISKSESIGDIPAFTFGNSGGPQFSNHISQFNPRKISLSSPSMNKRHSKSANSITFSSTVSLYTDTEKRQNSLLFYDLWGVPATNRSRANSTGDGLTKEQSNCSNVDENEESIGDIDMNMNGGYHNNQNSTSLSGMATTTSPGYKSTMTHTPSTSGFSMTRKPSTLLTGPIKEDQAEEWSDFQLLHGDASDPDDDEFHVDADDEDSEYVYNDKDKDKIPQTSLKKGSKKLSGGFRYRKRKSTLTADFIFGKTSNNV